MQVSPRRSATGMFLFKAGTSEDRPSLKEINYSVTV